MKTKRDAVILVSSVVAIAITSVLRGHPGEEVKQNIAIAAEVKTSNNMLKLISDSPVVKSEKSESIETFSFKKFEDKMSANYLGSVAIPSVEIEDSVYRDSGDNYYLNHDFLGETTDSGELFLDARSGQSLTDLGALINGHSMHNGSKFGNIKKLLKVQDQPYLYVYDATTNKSYKYTINSINLVDNKNSGLAFKFANQESQADYYNTLYNESIKQWKKPTDYDNTIMLATCSYIIDQGRYLLIASLEGEVINE